MAELTIAHNTRWSELGAALAAPKAFAGAALGIGLALIGLFWARRLSAGWRRSDDDPGFRECVETGRVVPVGWGFAC